MISIYIWLFVVLIVLSVFGAIALALLFLFAVGFIVNYIDDKIAERKREKWLK